MSERRGSGKGCRKGVVYRYRWTDDYMLYVDIKIQRNKREMAGVHVYAVSGVCFARVCV